ncbi:2Fe-2S iron-sulfur cluster-binding protein [Miniphocaeibacter massiliensis]|uniref:2Fe-2S iron-sulfur cluster-binding protein n=1 Tax=Miniphocaeibacter massiliensis TaxID=2041841 RepID=UPI000C1BB8D6|nr:2Fe-2S iron-sulfur cluster-binding protein [Miniphocaeibacter massiliensis]
MDFITLTINGKTATVPKGLNLVEAAKRVGIEIPTFCYEKSLPVVSSCRICVVEIEGFNKPVTACSTPAQEGMVVYTESEEVVNIRKTILRLMLDNHPSDCLTCSKNGSCKLQDYSYKYDVKFREHDGARRGSEEADFTDTTSPYILRDESKCILCGKCVRTCAVVPDRNILNFGGRGFDTKIIADYDTTLENSNCVSCNRCVAECPVGALVDNRSYRSGRIWELETKSIKCKSCDYGCNMKLLQRDGKTIAVKAEEPTNGRPLCLKGRLLTELEYIEEPAKPYKKSPSENGNKFVESSWTEVLGLGGVLDKLLKLDE